MHFSFMLSLQTISRSITIAYRAQHFTHFSYVLQVLISFFFNLLFDVI